ncbi:MAG TPA: double-strand break repair protein AddB [Xanthobacteraceae bacterium]|nr:double-strand break repair protein AddB [Xanthobacteraceae bacterium]
MPLDIVGATLARRVPPRTSRVYTIPPSAPFLPTLICALREGRLVDGFTPGPLDFADATIFLPTRRACRLARDAFLQELGVDAAVLPRIVPIGDIDEDELVFADMATGDVAFEALGLPRTLGGLERRFLLARLVLKWAEQIAPPAGETPLVVRHPAAALALADDLAMLMDDMTTRQVSWQRLDGLVPDELDPYWQLTLRFLLIAREAWPGILAERRAIEPATRRDRLIAAEAARLASRPDKPIIAAGSTGSMPATAKLLATIASLPHGAVVLPGLDTELDEESWNVIGGAVPPGHVSLPPAPGHPQFAMHALLARIGVKRRDVRILAAPSRHGREMLASEALRPAAATDQWRIRLGEVGTTFAPAFAGVTVIQAVNAEEEALAVAVVLREALCEPEGIAALVTPDRALARRVAVTLRRWNITADDSGGDPLAETAAGVFARLVAEAAVGGLAPVQLLALLKHPFARFGADEARHGRGVAALARTILRGPRPRPGSLGLIQALATFRGELAKLKRGETSDIHHADPRVSLTVAELDEAGALLRRVAAALEPLESAATSSGDKDFAGLAARHREAVRRASTDATGATFAGPDGVALATAFDEIIEKVGPFAVTVEDYPELFGVVIADRVVRRPGAPGNRIRIYGPLEARLTGIDRVVIGGLVEGVWPPDPRTDPWLSRPMRHALGLNLPERRIGLAAHDFAQLLGAREVFLTYSAKRDGAPTVASRFVQRLAAVAGAPLWEQALGRGERYRGLCRSLDAPKTRPQPVTRPSPRPPRAARPASLSVTEIEHWLRDPYTIYAKHILKLRPLDPVDERLGAAERGSIIHGAIGDFARTYADVLPDDPYGELLRFGERHFAPLRDFPEVRAFWWPRYERIAHWFADFEAKRRANIAAAHAEIHGELPIAAGSRVFRLTGRADRIERLVNGGYAVLDFKTGVPPSSKQVQIGVAPQLTLEAAMLRNGGFPALAPGDSIAELVYVRLNGASPAGEQRVINFRDRSVDAVADEALERLKALVNRFEDEGMPYRSLVLSMWTHRYGTYDDLARIKEWSLSGGAEGDEE